MLQTCFASFRFFGVPLFRFVTDTSFASFEKQFADGDNKWSARTQAVPSANIQPAALTLAMAEYADLRYCRVRTDPGTEHSVDDHFVLTFSFDLSLPDFSDR